MTEGLEYAKVKQIKRLDLIFHHPTSTEASLSQADKEDGHQANMVHTADHPPGVAHLFRVSCVGQTGRDIDHLQVGSVPLCHRDGS